MRPTLPIAAVAVLLLARAVAGCGDDSGFAFEAPSEDEIRDRVHAEPTAPLDADTLPWVLERTQDAVWFATAFLDFTRVYATSFGPDGFDVSALSGLPAGPAPAARYATTQSALTYAASGYIDFSCPGADLAAPDYTFASGNARVESPGVVAVEDIATLEDGAVFRLRFRDGCRVGGDHIAGAVFGVFETPWVLSVDVTNDVGDGPSGLRADIELAANRFTVVLRDPDDGLYRLIVTHPEGTVTSAFVDGTDARCRLDVERDPATGGYRLLPNAPRCESLE